MSVDLVVEMCSKALFLVIKTAAPSLLVSLIIGLTVSVFQICTDFLILYAFRTFCQACVSLLT